jgi:ankyrin repeat protein
MDDVIITRAMKRESMQWLMQLVGEIATMFGRHPQETLEEYMASRGFSDLHKALLNVDGKFESITAYLSASASETIKSLMDQRDSRGRTALTWAAEYNWATAVEVLIRFGANPHQLRPSLRGVSPLLHLCIAGSIPRCPGGDQVGTVKALLEAGVDVNARDHEGWTPLHVAASLNLYDVSKALFDFGSCVVDWGATTHKDETAVDLSSNPHFFGLMQNITAI